MSSKSYKASKQKGLRPAVFLDRDGTINVEKDYLHRVEDFEFISGAPLALKKLKFAGYLLIVVTNQSGIARGFFSASDVEMLHDHMCKELKQHGVDINGIYICPHHPTEGLPPHNIECDCRKGKPGLLLRAAKELHVDLHKSFMVGDKLSDAEAGIAAGCKALLVRSGHGSKVSIPIQMSCEGIFQDLPAAVEYILQQQ